MNILHISCSPNGQAAESLRLSRAIIARLLERSPSAIIVERRIAHDGVLPLDAGYAMALGGAAPMSDATAASGTSRRSEELIVELEQADVVVIGTPMHNFTVPASLKTWIDHVVRVHRSFAITAQGKAGRLRNRPVLVAVASGSRFSGENAHQPDFLTGYLRAILATVGLHDLHFFSVEGTVGESSLERGRAAAEQALHAYFADRSVAA